MRAALATTISGRRSNDASRGSEIMRVRTWDLPLRLFHWAIVLLVPALWATHHWDKMDLHILLGEILLGLVLWRLLWGIFGSSTARFASFVRGPGAVLNYLRGGRKSFGHNPLGGWSVVAMLLVLVVQIGLGLFAVDEDLIYGGPLSHLVSDDTARTLAHRHETVFWVLVGLIALHVAAILYYRLIKRDDLITPMITGRGEAVEGEEALVPAPLWRFALSVVIAAAITLVIALFL
jgi:cytochrome b